MQSPAERPTVPAVRCSAPHGPVPRTTPTHFLILDPAPSAPAALPARERHPARHTANVLHALRQLMGSEDAGFRSVEQAAALYAVLRRMSDLLVVLPTGAGKTLLFLLPPFVEVGLITVVVIPLVAVMEQVLEECLRRGVRAVKWTSDLGLHIPGPSTHLLLVAVEHATNDLFIDLMMSLLRAGRLSRIVVDECHLALTASDYRGAMRRLHLLRLVEVPLVLLTATLPPALEGELRCAMASNFTVLRQPTYRLNLAYAVRHLQPGENLVEEIRMLCEPVTRGQAPGEPRSLCLVYCRTIVECTFYAHALQPDATTYYSTMSAAERQESLRSWQAATTPVMLATTALGAGLHAPHVRLVVHIGACENLLAYAQETGRGGRDGDAAHAVTLVPSDQDLTRRGLGVEDAFFRNETQCRRFVLQDYLDGAGVDCMSLPRGASTCDICSHAQRESVSAPDSAPARPTSLPTTPAGRPMPRITTSSMRAQAVQASARENRVDMAGLQMQRNLGRIRNCVMCFWSQKQDQDGHTLLQHAQRLRKCVKCFGPHFITECPHRRLPPGIMCYTCGLPQRLGTVAIHSGPESFGGRACDSGAKDKVWALCWIAFREREGGHGALRLAMQHVPTTEVEFHVWLFQQHDGIPNILGLFNTVLDIAQA